MRIDKKLSAVKSLIENEGKVAISFSGGLASSVLLRIASQTPSIKPLAVTVDSPFLSTYAHEEVKRIAKGLQVNLRSTQLEPGIVSMISHNSKFRYYQYMWEVLVKVRREAGHAGIGCIITGCIEGKDPDSLGMRKAVLDFGAVNPFLLAKVNREDLLEMARMVGLFVESRQPTTFLPSLIPYGIPMTPGLLSRIDRAERILSSQGLHHSTVSLASEQEIVLRAHHSDIPFILGNSQRIRKEMTKLFSVMKVEIGNHESTL